MQCVVVWEGVRVMGYQSFSLLHSSAVSGLGKDI